MESMENVQPNVGRGQRFLARETFNTPTLATVVAVLVIGSGLRFFQLGRHGLFVDEAFSWALTAMPFDEMIRFSFQDGHPPLYYVLLKGLLAFIPASHVTLRVISALCSAASLVLLTLWTMRRYGVRAGIYAGWFLALSSFDLYYAQEARMYTPMSLLWLLAYILLLEGWHGRPRLLLAWGFINGLLAWMHFYGAFAVGLHLAFAGSMWLFQRWRNQTQSVSFPALVGGIALAVVMSGPVLYALWQNRSHQHNGTWVPNSTDLAMLFGLWSIGLTAARARLLDSSHLVVPAVADVGPWNWALVGMVLSGRFAVWALLQDLRGPLQKRLPVLLTAALVGIPVVVAYSYSSLFNLRMWALRAFLGGAYLFYLWAGIGLSRVPSAIVRRGVAAAMVVVTLLSLVPYYTTWQKSDAERALRSIPDEQPTVVLEPLYLSLIASFYLGPDANLWALWPTAPGRYGLLPLSAEQPLAFPTEAIDCATAEINPANDVYLYGNISEIREQWRSWPSCVNTQKIWVFDNNAWVVLNR